MASQLRVRAVDVVIWSDTTAAVLKSFQCTLGWHIRKGKKIKKNTEKILLIQQNRTRTLSKQGFHTGPHHFVVIQWLKGRKPGTLRSFGSAIATNDKFTLSHRENIPKEPQFIKCMLRSCLIHWRSIESNTKHISQGHFNSKVHSEEKWCYR